MRTLFAAILTMLGLALLLSGAYLGLVYFVGYDGVWTSDLLWIAVPAAVGLVLIGFGVRAIRAPLGPVRQMKSSH